MELEIRKKYDLPLMPRKGEWINANTFVYTCCQVILTEIINKQIGFGNYVDKFENVTIERALIHLNSLREVSDSHTIKERRMSC